MTISLKIPAQEPGALWVYYENLVFAKLRLLWQRKLMVLVIGLTGTLLTASMLILNGPSYTAEAMVEFNFDRADGKIPPIDTAILDGVARIRSRGTASAVVARLVDRI